MTTTDKSHEIKIVNSKQLTKTQQEFVHIYYWAAFYGQKDTLDLFLNLGLSPFMKMYKGGSADMAAI